MPPLALTVLRVMVLAPPDIVRETWSESCGKRVPAHQGHALALPLLGWAEALGPEVPSSAVCEDTGCPASLWPPPRVLSQCLFRLPLVPLVRALLGLLAFSQVYFN